MTKLTIMFRSKWAIVAVLTLMESMATVMTSAQDMKKFTLEDLIFGGINYHNMIAKDKKLAWWGNELIRLEKTRCYIVDKKTGNEKELFNHKEIELCLGEKVANQQNSIESASFPYPQKPLVMLCIGNTRFLVNFKTHKVISQQSTAKVNNADWNSLSGACAYTETNGYNLLVQPQNKDKAVQISTDASRNLLYGVSVHRDEFGYTKGTFWSPNGYLLAFTRMDQSMVADYPLVYIPPTDNESNSGESKMATLALEKYPMAGKQMHRVSIGVFDLKTGKTIYLKTGDTSNRYLTNPSWSPDSRIIYLFELNRDQNDAQLVAYDATTGERIKMLLRETDSKYVEPLHPITFLPWDHKKFIVQSQKDGYNHLYLYDTDGHELKQITSGRWVVMQVIGFNKNKHSVIIASNECNPIQRNLFEVDIQTGQRSLLDNGKGYHYGLLSDDGSYIIDRYSTPDTPRNIEITNIANKQHLFYFKADNPWKGYDIPAYECGTIKAADNTTDLYWRMVKPTHFDASKKYPTIIYVYGGPHAHNVEASWHWGSRSWETYMAQQGYLLFILDNRGSENRGRDFEQTTFRQLGQIEMQDQMCGIEFLKSLPYVDSTRLGIHGWSFGGFMTISLMTNYPNVFKVGVAGGPVIDWKWYEVMYGERYMDTPQSNPDGYAKTSLLKQAKNLKGKLQIIIGLNDPVVLPQHALSFLDACIKAGTQPDFFVYPGEPHNMRGHKSTHLHERISQYFFDYLR